MIEQKVETSQPETELVESPSTEPLSMMKIFPYHIPEGEFYRWQTQDQIQMDPNSLSAPWVSFECAGYGCIEIV